MELSGRPGPAEFYSPKWGRSSDSYNLTWKIDSYPPLEEVRLLYRRVLVSVILDIELINCTIYTICAICTVLQLAATVSQSSDV